MSVTRKEWFAITAFPLFAGTFGTIASALNICALVQPWKCDVSHEDSLLDIKNIPDPTWSTPICYTSMIGT
jgi:potassium channel subfamily K